MRPVYLDHHATTPVDPRVLEAMLPYFTETFGNAASKGHAWGETAEDAVAVARADIAAALGAEDAKSIVFTSGATESDNLALQGAMAWYRERGNHLIVSAIEHKAVLDTARALEKTGIEVTVLPVDTNGQVSPDVLDKAITPHTVLVSIMHANNEIGTIQPLQDLVTVAHRHGALFHTDATQSVGHVPLDVAALDVDLLSFSAHKLYGPKGVGGLYVRRHSPRVRLSPILHGGGHEAGMRSGTLNVPGIVGMAAACKLAMAGLADETARLLRLKERLAARLLALPGTGVNGHPTDRLAGNLNMWFRWVEGESVSLQLAHEVAVSTGSACTSASLTPSHVLRAIGLSDDLANASVRFGLGRFTTETDIDFAAERVGAAVERLRSMSPLYRRTMAVEPTS
ncbi:MAG TPA: aminotransferase class V-fold PLP-dependent enzyme [Candidatus Xenobia bacterium]|jgi:cysteine desulfurase